MAPQNASWLSKLKGIDAYPKTIEEFKVRTMQGGIFSMLAFAAIGILLFSEVSYYFASDTVDRMLVDGARNTLVPINFDIDFPNMPCSIIAVETADMAGTVQHDVVNNIEKIALDRNGQPHKEGVKDTIGGALTNHTDLHERGETERPACGSCYSAGEPGQCCNTCDDVKRAYDRKNWIMPSLHTISQCQEQQIEQVLRGQVNEGCRIKGFLLVGKVAGKVYFAPSKYFRNGYLSAQDLVEATFRTFDTSHRINTLAFGASYPDMKNPLDKRAKDLGANTRGSFQYFLKVVPTEYKYLGGSVVITNQYSATEHFKELTPLSEKGLPMVTLSYSFSPIMFRIEEVRRGLLQFLTSVCAIIGGVFTIMGVLDSVFFSLLNKSSRAPLAL
ncbi:hypothetical protein Poli38472_004579 [Pythium oligandrum]|uniref:Uncharacterized protein n=1 Tax=Pythium oligandrum TaxID=41045 RepID=A0A8K1CB12_PYTOL|nr:hypothetical protein Poli38472_004579 [Pythium oligandrum]|eukprot:TMW59510.1 hypothetical protein Poli38472_004579 [Pythium oligandrum]